eukprot:tig00021348_g20537.t1
MGCCSSSAKQTAAVSSRPDPAVQPQRERFVESIVSPTQVNVQIASPPAVQYAAPPPQPQGEMGMEQAVTLALEHAQGSSAGRGSDRGWAVVRVYIASSSDAGGEREQLEQAIFPRLNRWGRVHRICFEPVDLRKGTRELPGSLVAAEIDRARPWFMAVVRSWGEGQLGPDPPALLPHRLPRPAGPLSLECEYGALAGPAQRLRAFAALASGADGAPLAARLAQRFAPTTLRYDAAGRGGFQQLAGPLFDSLSRAALAEYGSGRAGDPDDDVVRDEREMRRWAAAAARHYVPSGGAATVQSVWQRAAQARCTLLAGEAGAGKTSLLARLCVDAWQPGSGWGAVAAYFPEACARAPSVPHALRRVCLQLAAILGLPETDVPPANEAEELAEAAARLCQELPHGAPVLVVVDGADELGAGDSLDWLPIEGAPSHVHFLVAVDASRGALLRAAQAKRAALVQLERRAEGEAGALLAAAAASGLPWGPRRADPWAGDAAGLARRPDGGLPLFLALAQALVRFSGGDAGRCPGTVQAAVQALLERVEAAVGREAAAAILSVLALSRAGIAERDAAAAAGPQAAAAWATAWHAGVAALCHRRAPGPDGDYYALRHAAVARAVRGRYLCQCPAACPDFAVAAHCEHLRPEKQVPGWAERDGAWHRRLAAVFVEKAHAAARGGEAGRWFDRKSRDMARAVEHMSLAPAWALLMDRAGSLPLAGLGCSPADAHGVSEGVRSSRQLTALDLDYCHLGEGGIFAICDALKESRGVKKLTMGRNHLLDSGAQALAGMLARNGSLTELVMASCTTTVFGFQAIAGVLRSQRTLATLNLASCKIGAEGAEALGEALRSNSGLQTLLLRNNHIAKSRKGAPALPGTGPSGHREAGSLGAGQKAGGRHEGADADAVAERVRDEMNAIDWAAMVDRGLDDDFDRILAECISKHIRELRARTDTRAVLKRLQNMKDFVATLSTITSVSELSVRQTLRRMSQPNLHNTAMKVMAAAPEYGEEPHDDTSGEATDDEDDEFAVYDLSGIQGLCGGLRAHRTLTRLDLANNELYDEGLQEVADVLANSRTLAVLSLESTFLTNDGLRRLAGPLASHGSLRELVLCGNKFNDDGVQWVAQALEQNAVLEVLDLSENRVGDRGAAALARALEQNRSLRRLALSKSIDRVKVESAGCQALLRALRSNAALQTLELDGQNGAGGEHLAGNRALTCLSLVNSGISARGAAGLAQALQQNTALRTLRLSKNSLGPDRSGAPPEPAFGAFLARNRSLQELLLADCGLGPQAPAPAAPPRPARLTGAGCGALLEALGQNGGLRKLDLASNGLTDDVAGVAAAALRRNATLTHLNLEGNPAPPCSRRWRGGGGGGGAAGAGAGRAGGVGAGARELAGALARSRSLRSLRLRGAQLRDDEGRALAKGVAESPALEELDLLGGNLSPHAHVALLEALHLSPRVAAKFFFECDFY